MNQIIEFNVATMSSREIAEMAGKEHKNVLRDIDKIVDGLGSELSRGYKSTTYTDANGVQRRMFEMDKDACLCLVTGYDVSARMKIIKRWQELEEQIVKPVINLNDPAFLRNALLSYTEKVIELEQKIEEQKDDVAFAKAIESSVNCISVEIMAKIIGVKGLGRNKFYSILRDWGMLQEGGASHNIPYQRWIDSGHFEVRENVFTKNETVFISHTTLITGKGQKYIVKKLNDIGYEVDESVLEIEE